MKIMIIIIIIIMIIILKNSIIIKLNIDRMLQKLR